MNAVVVVFVLLLLLPLPLLPCCPPNCLIFSFNDNMDGLLLLLLLLQLTFAINCSFLSSQVLCSLLASDDIVDGDLLLLLLSGCCNGCCDLNCWDSISVFWFCCKPVRRSRNDTFGLVTVCVDVPDVLVVGGFNEL